MGVAKLKEPFAITVVGFAALFTSVTCAPGFKPAAVPEIVYELVQLTSTVTFAPLTVPLAPATVQIWPVGCVRTVTAYAMPAAADIEKLNCPLVETVVLLPALFCSTRLAPLASPETAPPTEYIGETLLPPPHALSSVAHPSQSPGVPYEISRLQSCTPNE